MLGPKFARLTFPLIVPAASRASRSAAQPASAQATRTWGVRRRRRRRQSVQPDGSLQDVRGRDLQDGRGRRDQRHGCRRLRRGDDHQVDHDRRRRRLRLPACLPPAPTASSSPPGVNDTVTLRNLDINGVMGTPDPGLNGVQFNCRRRAHHRELPDLRLQPERHQHQREHGIALFAYAVTDTVASNSAGGIAAKNASTGRVTVSAKRVSLLKNSSFGIKGDGDRRRGGDQRRSVGQPDCGKCARACGAAGGASGTVILQVTRSSVVNNVTTGVRADGAANSIALLSETLVAGNGTGLRRRASVSVATYQEQSTQRQRRRRWHLHCRRSTSSRAHLRLGQGCGPIFHPLFHKR